MATVALIVCWVVWGAAFVGPLMRSGRRRAAVTESRSLWGALLEMSAFLVALVFRDPAVAPWRSLGALCLAPAAPLAAWWEVAHLGKQFRVRAGLYPDHDLVRTGPYRLVRHPIYLSVLLLLVATGLQFSRWPALLAALALFIAGTEFRVRVEDRLLAERFGASFQDYRSKVRAYIPFLR